MSSDYQQLTVWTRSKDLAVAVYRRVDGSVISKGFGLRDQIRRTAVSVPSHIAEGDTRESDSDRAHFLTIARSLIEESSTKKMRPESDGIFRMLYALRSRIRESVTS